MTKAEPIERPVRFDAPGKAALGFRTCLKGRRVVGLRHYFCIEFSHLT
jgi:hypothetical protein